MLVFTDGNRQNTRKSSDANIRFGSNVSELAFNFDVSSNQQSRVHSKSNDKEENTSKGSTECSKTYDTGGEGSSLFGGKIIAKLIRPHY